MKLIFQPVKPFHVTQKFGENIACKPADGTQKVIVCDGHNPPAGWVSLYGPKGHQAIDIWTSHGQQVFAAQDGVVYKIDTDARSGLDVRIEHEVKGQKFRTIYEHLMSYIPKVGDTVKCGQVIGYADNTGWSAGDHLHFVLELWDGNAWVRVDPLLYMEDMSAIDYLRISSQLTYIKEAVASLAQLIANKLRK
jgi:murein DD-endopeptidase MepM/ murein hydrolase activator NlpD